MSRQYAVFGAGEFGFSIAVALQELGWEIIVVDRDPEVIQEIADRVSYAVCADLDDPVIFEKLGLHDLDGAIISITERLETSIVVAMTCKEMGVPRILAKARNKTHEKILRSVGVHKVIYPEVEMGRRIAKYLAADNFVDWIELSPKYSLVEMNVPAQWCGKCLLELGVREKYRLNVIGIKHGDSVNIHIDPKQPLLAEDVLIVVGENEDLNIFQD